MKNVLLVISLTIAVAVSGAGASAQTASLDPGQYGLLVKLHVSPEQRDNFANMMEARVIASSLRPEVVDFRVLSTPDANAFLAFESFKDKQGFSAFEKLPDSQIFLTELKPLLSSSVEATVLTPLP
jgi:quinol monooxygenase YgiN